LITECSATAAAIKAIRAVNPTARLIQTEDIGKTHSTAKLAYQANLENARRWLSLDVLLGRVQDGHPLWDWLRSIGFDEQDFERIRTAYCPPDVIGVNYYITSERFLDDALELYPTHVHGGNGRDRYADVEAVRVRAEGIAGFGGVLREVWERYKLPMAVTEVHIGADEEDQLRWLAEAWQDAETVRQEGADIAAITVWSLLGAYGWRTLVTSDLEFYEPGVFDLSGIEPRPTPLATMVRDLAAGHPPAIDPVLSPGWWRRPDRLVYPPRSSGEECREEDSTVAA
jgi:dTDP-4-dehydrorhamnose reductase